MVFPAGKEELHLNIQRSTPHLLIQSHPWFRSPNWIALHPTSSFANWAKTSHNPLIHLKLVAQMNLPQCSWSFAKTQPVASLLLTPLPPPPPLPPQPCSFDFSANHSDSCHPLNLQLSPTLLNSLSHSPIVKTTAHNHNHKTKQNKEPKRTVSNKFKPKKIKSEVNPNSEKNLSVILDDLKQFQPLDDQSSQKCSILSIPSLVRLPMNAGYPY